MPDTPENVDHEMSWEMPSEKPWGMPWVNISGNALKLLHLADDRLRAVIETIESADKSLKLCFYMFEGDDIGKTVLNSLIAACERGVTVELIVDSFGSNGAPRDFFDPLVKAGGTFAIFSPRFSTSYFVRNHQKILIADNARGLIGGFNIANQYFDQHFDDGHIDENPNSWEDLGLLIHGPEMEQLSEYYERLMHWVISQNGNIRSLRKMIKSWPAGEGRFRWLLGGPSNRLSRWAWSIKNDLEDGHRLDLVSAYFSPGQGLVRRIARLSKQGGTSRLILAGQTDNWATIGASRSLYRYLLKRKANLFEYQRKRLHMKLVIVDDIVYIGSANFDLRSLFINVEIMLRVEDRELADQAREIADTLIESSEAVSLTLHKERTTFFNRIKWALSYFVVGTMDYSVTRRFNFGVKK